MKLKLITCPFDPVVGGFPAEPLTDIPGEVVSVVEHFFHHQGTPYLLLVVHYRESASPVRKETKEVKGVDISHNDVSATLTPDERELYERLRAWRNGRAHSEAVPSYTLFSNRQIADIARLRPTSLTALQKLSGIGDGRIGKYGAALLEVISSAPPDMAPPLMGSPLISGTATGESTKGSTVEATHV